MLYGLFIDHSIIASHIQNEFMFYGLSIEHSILSGYSQNAFMVSTTCT